MGKIKEFLVKVLTAVKNVVAKVVTVAKKVFAFLKKNYKWFLYGINLVVVGFAYNAYPDNVLVGGWFFVLIAWILFWKILRGEKLFQKDDE